MRKRKYDREANRGYKLKTKYGITTSDYNRMYIEQGGRCKICGTPAPLGGKGRTGRLHVDHCHSTGRVRGLLCYACNGILGLAGDDAAVLESSISYLSMG